MNPDEERMGLPPHGSRRRYRVIGCRCIACTRGSHGANVPDELRWPFRWLDKTFGDQIPAWYSAEQIAEWKAHGLGDFEADEVCIRLGEFPHSVFPGYQLAGVDCDVYP